MTDELTVPQKIRAAIDYEKPLFDYARYQLTFLGWALAVAAIYSPAASWWQWIFLAPAIVIGFALNYRLSILGESSSTCSWSWCSSQPSHTGIPCGWG